MKSQAYLFLAIAVIGFFLAGPICRADFTLVGSEQFTESGYDQYGNLYGNSEVSIVPGGNVDWIVAYDSSTVNLNGGSVNAGLFALDNSTVNITSGTPGEINAQDNATVSISGPGAHVPDLIASGSSTVNISSGTAAPNNQTWYYAEQSSTLTFYVQSFQLGTGLALNGNQISGTGYISGTWADGTPMNPNSFSIAENDSGATIKIQVVGSVPAAPSWMLISLFLLIIITAGPHLAKNG